MDEENKQEAEKEKPKETAADIRKRDKQEMLELIKQSNAAAERLEKANTEKELLNAEAAMGGYAEAGKAKEKPKEESPEEYTERFMRGEANPLEDDGVRHKIS